MYGRCSMSTKTGSGKNHTSSEPPLHNGLDLQTRCQESVLPFVSSTGVKRDNPNMRKLIRSYVMQGKNRGRGRGETRQPKRNESLAPVPTETCTNAGVGSTSLLGTIFQPSAPRKLISEIPFVQFSDTIELPAVAVILEFLSVEEATLYPLEKSIRFHKKKRENELQSLAFDTAYVHAAAFTSQFYLNGLAGIVDHTFQHRISRHFGEAIRLLRHRLLGEDDTAKISDSTMLLVLALATHAHLAGEYETARHHLEGFRKMTTLRGGIFSLACNSKLPIETFRCDIGMALHYGLKPIFFRNQSLEPFLPYPHYTPFTAYGTASTATQYILEKGLSDSNGEVYKAWKVMRNFCSVINASTKTHSKLRQDSLEQTMASVMYRLLNVTFDNGSLDEATSLSLLVFCAHVFLSGRNIWLSTPHLSARYRDCLFTLKADDASPELILCFLFIGALSLFGESEDVWLKPWLREKIILCGVKSWDEMRGILKSFIWIDLEQGDVGEKIFLTTV